MVRGLICMISTKAFYPAFVHSVKRVNVSQDTEKVKINSQGSLYHILHLPGCFFKKNPWYSALLQLHTAILEQYSYRGSNEDQYRLWGLYMVNMFMNKSNRTGRNQISKRYCQYFQKCTINTSETLDEVTSCQHVCLSVLGGGVISWWGYILVGIHVPKRTEISNGFDHMTTLLISLPCQNGYHYSDMAADCFGHQSLSGTLQ